jgi:hypothetical protein
MTSWFEMAVDPFLSIGRTPRLAPVQSVKGHSERAHSKFSASGADRWFKCPGSVELSEGLPDQSSPWAEEGTRAHEVLEKILLAAIESKRCGIAAVPTNVDPKAPREMITHGLSAANFIGSLHVNTQGSDILVETRIRLDFIHPQMFGTFDGAVVDHFGTLHVFDYKYGAGHAVSPKGNLQMIFYGIGLAHQYGWNFKRVRLWIIQPRIKGYDGPMFWELTLPEIQTYVGEFRAAVDRVEKMPGQFFEGQHCHWCKAKSICPLKREEKINKAKSIFSLSPLKNSKT